MPKLQDITALPKDAVDLLEAAGYLDARDLAEAEADGLLAELAKANKKLRIMETDPAAADIAEWMEISGGKLPPRAGEAPEESSGEETAPDEPAHDEPVHDEPAPDGQDRGVEPEQERGNSAFVNFEDDPEVREMLRLSPEALPLEPSLIRRHKLKVSEIPEGLLLTQCRGEVEINLMPPERMTRRQRREAELQRTGLSSSRIRCFDEAESVPHHVKPLERGERKEAVSPSDGLNAGVRPESRRFVRGVLHPHAASVRVSAFFALLVEVLLVANFIGIPWMLWHEYKSGDSMLWWVVGLSAGLLLSALCYLFWGISARCRVCGQRQFAPKKCLKNKKAHHIPLVGYIFPTALHALFFKWFYCTYCGTAVRLKK